MRPKTTTVFAQMCNMLQREPLIRITQDCSPCTDGRKTNALRFTTWDLLCALLFCHLGRCRSLRSIEDVLFTAQHELHHARDAQFLCRLSLSHLNNRTDYRIFEKYYYFTLATFRNRLKIKFSGSLNRPVFS